MSALHRKLLRDLWRMRGQVIAIVAVVACGIASYVAMLSTHASLRDAGAAYFDRHRFPDVFARVAYAPRSVAHTVAAIPGVDAVETRIVQHVTIDVRGLPEPALGRMVSLPLRRRATFNLLHLERGRMPEPGRTNEVVVNTMFADAHQLALGEEVGAIIGGRKLSLRIVGAALSPEYIFSMAPGAMFPDDKRFGVFWMDDDALAAALDKEGGFNDLTLSLSRGASEPEVIAAVDSVLRPYGGRGAHGRDLQMSARFVNEELKGLESMGSAVPTMFLMVAAFLLNVVLTRLIAGQREQIAALKALGYSNFAVGLHYCEMMVVVVAGGTALGAAVGGMLGEALIGVYHDYYKFPALSFRLRPELLAGAASLALAAGFLGTIFALRRAVALPPAEAMRPQAPATYRQGLLSRLGLAALLGQAGRIVLRNVERRPGRTLLSSLGIAFGVGIMIAGTFSMDALGYVMEIGFQRTQREDVSIAFTRPMRPRVLEELGAIDGVLSVEPGRDIPVRLRAGHRSFETALQGLPTGGELRQLLDKDLNKVDLPPTGVLLTDVLGQRLQVDVGDAIQVEVLEGRRLTHRVVVAGLVDEVMGMNAYARMSDVNRLMAEGRRLSGARLLIDPAQRDAVYRRLKQVPNVGAASLRTASYEVFMETTGSMQTATAMILGILAAIVTIGVVYNGARVVLAERSRELASMRVMGFTRRETSMILLGELGVHLVLAIPLGCVLGYLFAYGALAGVDAELYRFPLYIEAKTYVLSCVVVVIAGIGAALLVRRRVDKLDLVGVLKTRE